MTHAIHIRDFPRDDCARNMSEEKSTTRPGLICAKILLCICMHSHPISQSNNLTGARDSIENSDPGQRSTELYVFFLYFSLFYVCVQFEIFKLKTEGQTICRNPRRKVTEL